jgi:hypothetical protein
MMTDGRDQLLQTAFAEARQDLDGEAITARVIARTRNLLYVLVAGGISVALALVAGVWLVFGIPLLEFAVLTSQVLTTALLDLGEGWLALVFMPVNNIAGLLVLTARALHLGWKKLVTASFAS